MKCDLISWQDLIHHLPNDNGIIDTLLLGLPRWPSFFAPIDPDHIIEVGISFIATVIFFLLIVWRCFVCR